MSPSVWPLSLILIRLVLGPTMIVFAKFNADPGPWLAVGVVVGSLTDLFDGILARHLGVATPQIRRLDSQTDLFFWLCVVGCVFATRWEVASANCIYVAAMIALETAIYATSIAKFGREACTHAYSAKAWCVVAVGAFVAILAFDEDKYSFPVLFAAYCLSWFDVIAIILILPSWQCDVPSCYHAWLVRRGIPFRTWKLFH